MTITTSSTDVVDSSTERTTNSQHSEIQTYDLGFIPIPQRLRYHPEKPFHFGPLLNVSFGFASTFTVANLYWCQPLLIELSKSFDVSYDTVSRIPTLLQAGYAVGLLLISPLGDLVRRRQLLLCVVTASASLSIGLAITKSLVVFETLSFLVGVVTVTPMILLPLAADLAPPESQATAISVVLAGLHFGILIARVLAGIVAEYTTWRAVYYLSVGVQYLVVLGTYLIIPDFPAKNKGLTYWDILCSMAKFTITEPTLVQGCLICIPSMACFTNFWVTLTFLLGGNPYNYSTLDIGLFGFVGMAGVALGPVATRLTRGLVPWYTSLLSIAVMLPFQAIQVGAGGVNIGPVIITAFSIDIFRQLLQVAISTSVFKISGNARARLNAVLVISLFIGQVIGTSVGTEVFLRYGWRVAAALNLGWFAFQLVILFLRGPHCERYTWFGYQGGFEYRNSPPSSTKDDAEQSGGNEEKEGLK